MRRWIASAACAALALTSTDARASESTPGQAPTTSPSPPAPSEPKYPYLMLGGGALLGPHAYGTEECRPQVLRCDRTGTFLGLGAHLEARPRLWRWLYAHGRLYAVGNVSPRAPVYRGAWGFGVGLGAYARRVFGRGEYVFIDAFGDNALARPFSSEASGRVRFGHHAGLFSVGFRQPLPKSVTLELWGGVMIGPHSDRAVPGEPLEQYRLLTFMLGLNAMVELRRRTGKTHRRRETQGCSAPAVRACALVADHRTSTHAGERPNRARLGSDDRAR